MGFVRASGLCGIALSVGSSACMMAPSPREPDEVAKTARAATTPTADTGGARAELAALRRHLEAELAVVEAALAKLAPEMDLTGWEQLTERRLSILVALLQVERAIALDLPLPPPSGAAPPPADKPQQGANSLADRLIADAALRVAAERRAQQLADSHGQGWSYRRLYEKVTGYDFEDDTIDGDLRRPGTLTGAAPEFKQEPAKPRPVLTPPPKVQLPLPDPNLLPPDEKAPDSRGASVVSHSAPPANVMPAVAQHLDRLLECFPAEQRSGAGVTLRVRTMLASDGSFREPRVTANAELPPLVVGCVTDVLSRVRAPAPAGGSRVISFPLHLRGSR